VLKIEYYRALAGVVFITVLMALSSMPAIAQGTVVDFDEITVTATRDTNDSSDSTLGASSVDKKEIAAQRPLTSDSAHLLRDIPGISLYGAGGISSLPAIHGLADDRLRIQVDGADLMPACPNHMNSPLSYIDPTKVADVTVFSGVTPVSVGGDSIGGSIQIKSAPPEFANPGDKFIKKGQVGSFFRSNGNAYGYRVGATVAGQAFNLTYTESNSRSDNYKAGKAFKAPSKGSETGPLIPGDEVGSSAYRGSTNRTIGLALKHDSHMAQLDLSQQTVAFEGFPNQRMDMTSNDNKILNFRYSGQFFWGDLEGRFSYQETKHKMDMGPDRYFYGTGMPMDTEAKTRNASVKGNIYLTDRDMLRIGVEYQYYTLYDSWPPVGGTMGPNTFWNIDYGRREKSDTFAEWEARWNDLWTSQVGFRYGLVNTNAAPVQGYDNGLAALWGNDAAAFNALKRNRTDYNWDMTAMVKYTPTVRQTYELGYARKTRSPNLYQRYPWATNAMAALMNNFVGDGNGYIGNVDLKPEVANTVSVTGDWHDAAREQWGIKATGYYTHVQDYMDAKRCDFGQCSAENVTTTSGFVLLQYVNQTAQLYGLDLSGHLLLNKSDNMGSFTGTGVLNFVRGENLTTGDNLYNIMPLNVKVALVHRLKGWTASPEILLVAGKKHVSHVRNEIETGGYWLMNLRSSYEWKNARVDFAIENLFDRLYYHPLGGAYVGQGPSMTTKGIPWGIAVPGMGRSFNLSVNLSFG
jgi:iron complex outermembrane recepter protein